MNLNIEQLNKSLSKGGPIFKMINLIMSKYDLDYKGVIIYEKLKRVSNKVDEFEIKRIKKETDIKELLTINYWGCTMLYKKEHPYKRNVSDYYWRIYNFIDNKLDEIDIDLNTISKNKLKCQLNQEITKLEKQYQECRNKLINPFQILDKSLDEICNTSTDNRKLHWKCELFEIEGKIQSLKYIIDNFLISVK
jgi:hypothetical protein